MISAAHLPKECMHVEKGTSYARGLTDVTGVVGGSEYQLRCSVVA